MSNEIAVQKNVAPALSMSEDELILEKFVAMRGYEGIYEISNHGNIISLARVHIPAHGKRQTTRSRLLTQHSNGKGYWSVRLWKNGNQSIRYVYRLVLEAFVGNCPNGQECCHGERGSAFNYLSNLRWDTKKNNHADKFLHGTIGNGEKARSAKLTAHQVIAIRMRLARGEEQSVMASTFYVSQPTISDIANRRTWKHI